VEYCFEIKAERGIDINPGDYFETAVLVNGKTLPGTEGRDDFNLNALLLPGKRVAGFGRRRSYALQDLPAGLSALEVAPSEKVHLGNAEALAFKICTNVILDQGVLAHRLSLGVAKNGGPLREIPLNCPDVKIDWQSRGIFVITVDQI